MKEYSIGTTCLHVLDSSMDAMKIKIYLVYWHQDHRYEDIYMSYDQEEEMKMEFLCGTQY